MTLPDNKITIALDITKEKKDLKLVISEYEKKYKDLFEEVKQIQEELNDFQLLYDAKVRSLQERLNELENLLFKYTQISEYVDDIFTYADAEKVFEETQTERQKKSDREKQEREDTTQFEKQKRMSIKDKEELKRLYRNLAHLFHPDKTGGNEEMMKRINYAYREGNLSLLRDWDMKYVPPVEDETLRGLELHLITLKRRIAWQKKEMVSLRKSDMYQLQKKLSITNAVNKDQLLNSLENEIKAEIQRKEEEVETFLKKFRHHEHSQTSS